MKILLINNFHYRKGGSETVYFNTADILQQHGHEVIFFSCVDEKNEPCRQQDFFIKPNNKLSKLKGAIRYFYNTEAKRKIEKLILAEKPDIAHIHLFWGGISPSVLNVLHKYNIPVVHTVHDYRMVCPAYTFRTPNGNICEDCQGKHFYKCVKHRCSKGSLVQSILMAAEMYERNMFFNPTKKIDGFIFVSEFSRAKHIEYAPAFAKVASTVIYNTTKQPAEEFLSHKDRRYFLYFGRLSSEKGVETLINAFKELPDIRLMIVGTGEEETRLKELAASFNNIEFKGYKQGDDLKRIISDASFIIVPSEWYENNPMTIIEGYMQGVPVIGSAIGGIPEIIENGKTGYTFTCRDRNDLIAKIKKASGLSDAEYAQMSISARQFADNNFNEEEHYNKLITFYKQIINNTHEHIQA